MGEALFTERDRTFQVSLSICSTSAQINPRHNGGLSCTPRVVVRWNHPDNDIGRATTAAAAMNANATAPRCSSPVMSARLRQAPPQLSLRFIQGRDASVPHD